MKSPLIGLWTTHARNIKRVSAQSDQSSTAPRDWSTVHRLAVRKIRKSNHNLREGHTRPFQGASLHSYLTLPSAGDTTQPVLLLHFHVCHAYSKYSALLATER
jgi:hypothetical protein